MFMLSIGITEKKNEMGLVLMSTHNADSVPMLCLYIYLMHSAGFIGNKRKTKLFFQGSKSKLCESENAAYQN